MPENKISQTFISVYFIFFALLNAVLAYSPLPEGLKVFLGVLGLGGGCWFYLWAMNLSTSQEEVPWKKSFISFPGVWTALFLALAVIARTYKLTSFLTYPISDEMVNAFDAIHLNLHWTWFPFFYTSRMPPFYIWFLSWLFRMGGVSFFNMWLLPAFFSFVSVLFYWLAAREWFSRPFSQLFLALLSVSFWPVFMGRFSHQAVLMVMWQAIAFWLLAKYFKSESASASHWLSLGLGLCVGTGFYTYFAWPLVALLIAVTLGWRAFRGPSRGKTDFVLFGASAFFSLLPLLLAGWEAGFGRYYLELLVFNKHSADQVNWNFQQTAYYVTNFLWSGWTKDFAYNSQWGGFLNPLMGSWFLIGLIELWRCRRHPFPRWMAVGFFGLFSPCLFANNTNWYHVVPLIPFFFGTVAIGFVVWYSSLPNKTFRAALVLGIGLLSVILDAANMEVSLGVANREYSSKFAEKMRACETLRELNRQSGPGLVFCDFQEDFWFPCYLTVTTYSFNALRNTDVTPAAASWAAIVTDDWQANPLTKTFSGVKFGQLNPPNTIPNCDLFGMIPLTPDNRSILEGWRKEDETLFESDFLNFNHPLSTSHMDLAQYLLDRQQVFQPNSIPDFYYYEKIGMFQALDRDSTDALNQFKLAAQSVGLKDPWVARMGGFGIPVPALENPGTTSHLVSTSPK